MGFSPEEICKIYEDGVAEIGGYQYRLTATNHAKRRTVFAFFSRIVEKLDKGDFSFIEDPAFVGVERVIDNVVLFDGDLISRRPMHWEEFPEHYMLYVTTFMAVISYPFLRGVAGG
jgi:hypothetical protein